MTKHCFETFQKRYQKKKNTLKESNRSGTSTAMVEEDQRDYDQFQRPSIEIPNAKRKRKGNEMFFSQREISEVMNASSGDDDDCSIDDETNGSHDQDL